MTTKTLLTDHNGTEKGYLFVIDEPVIVGQDIYQHPPYYYGSEC